MRRTARVKQQAQMLAAGVALLALILCSLFFILQGTRPSGAKMMEKALAQLEQQQNYNLAITEKAPHKLFFQGRVENGNQLRGILRDYNLEVLSQEDSATPEAGRGLGMGGGRHPRVAGLIRLFNHPAGAAAK